jgi:ABC-type multidrug transport system ATPase subunit
MRAYRDSCGVLQGYVEQMDLHSPFATVEEAIKFSAKLRLSANIPNRDKDHFVEVREHLAGSNPTGVCAAS